MATHGIHEGLEDLRKGTAWIVSEHTNVRGDETVIIEFEGGTRRSIPNVKPETLKMYMEAHETGQKITGGKRGAGRGGPHGIAEAMEELRKGNAKIVSEHTNIRGDETVLVEFKDGTRRSIPNVKKETLEEILQAQEYGRKQRPTSQ